MSIIQVVGIGLAGAANLTAKVQQLVTEATVLVGSDRHLSYFPHHNAKRLFLKDFQETIQQIRTYWQGGEKIVILVTGDPLFFGFGRLLLQEFPASQLQFYPQLSSVQLAFNQLKMPWQDAKIVSVHGRNFEELTKLLQQGVEKIAVLTSRENNPAAIARLFLSLDVPVAYNFWVCENLGAEEEKITAFTVEQLKDKDFSPLNVVVLYRQNKSEARNLIKQDLPKLGLPDHLFASFPDRPGLMTKREIRLLILGELSLQEGQIVWDIGAGTGSVSVEIARLCPQSTIYAVEKTALGISLIKENCQRFQVENVLPIQGKAPEILAELPPPNRIFLGGSGGNLKPILDTCASKLTAGGLIILALATLENLQEALTWLQQHNWSYHLLQAQISRSVPVANLTRFTPLNPVTIVVSRQSSVVS